MKFSISSDLHLDFRPMTDADLIRDQINNCGADVHFIAGDVANSFNESEKFVRQIPHSLFFAGNHEFYDRKWEPFDNGDVSEFGGVTVFHGTLWTDFNKGDPLTEVMVNNVLNDSFWIKGYSVDLIKKINARMREQIFDLQPDVVVTHHAPSHQSIAERYKAHHHMNGGFVNDYDNYILDSKIKVWCHGHTHTRMDYMIGNTRVICNPLGYRGENATPWNPVVFEL